MNAAPNRMESTLSRERVGRGILGAALFSLAGALTYYIFWTVGIIAALSGLIGVIGAIKGYEIFARQSTKRGIAIAVAVAAGTLILTWYLCVCLGIRDTYEALYEAGEVEGVPPMSWCLANGLSFLPINPAALWDLIVSLALGALGCWGYVARSLRVQEEAAARRAAQNRTMELARLQAEQAERAARTTEELTEAESGTVLNTAFDK